METITVESMIADLREIVQGNEDRKAACMYRKLDPRTLEPLEPPQGECIAGVWFERHGLLEDIQEGRDAHSELKRLAEAGVLVFEDQAGGLLSQAQRTQDNGRTWGEALERAIKLFGPKGD